MNDQCMPKIEEEANTRIDRRGQNFIYNVKGEENETSDHT